MSHHPRISSIYRHGPADHEPIGQEAERRNKAARAAAWHKAGLVVIDPEDIHDDWLRQAIINEANQRYGRRGRKNGKQDKS